MKPYYEDKEACIAIYHGDCREVLPNLGEEIGGIVTDPPYGMGRFDTDGKDFLESVGPALRTAWALVGSPGSMFVFMSPAEVVNVANAVGRDFKRLLWMYKPADMTYPLGGWLLTSEAILWFHKGDSLGLCERRPYRHDCYVASRIGREGVEGHPTVKPLDVVQDLVARVPGMVLDPFMGSGTTLRAAMNIRQAAIGIEIEERYCAIAAQRLEQQVIDFNPPALTSISDNTIIGQGDLLEEKRQCHDGREKPKDTRRKSAKASDVGSGSDA